MKYLLLAITAALTVTAKEPSPPEAPPSLSLTGYCTPHFSQSIDVTCDAYGEFLYMQPNGTQLYYGATAIGIAAGLPFPASIASPDWTILEINPDYHPGFEIGIGFTLREPNVQIGSRWQWLHGNDSNSFQASNAAGHMVGPFFDIGPNAASYKIAKGKASSHFDQVDLLVAKNLCFFDNFHTRLYGAASFLHIKESLHSKYSNVSGSIVRNVDTTSTFTAGGPQIGLDYDYSIYNGFFFSGKSSFSLFVGQIKNTTKYQSYTPELALLGLAQPNNQATAIPNRVQVIPAFEQKLGFSYVALWNQVKAIFEIGYQCQIYLNAVQMFNMASQAVPVDLIASPDVGVFAVAFEQSSSNFMLLGPYATVGVRF